MKSHFSPRAFWKFSAPISSGVLGAILLAPAASAAGTTWWVSNQGKDSASCGNRATPCRSISAAIDKAANGDVIGVGAGLYGDLNGDGEFTAPGEEHYGTDSTGRTCIVCVDKAIKILSLHGADETVIDAGNGGRPDPNSPVGMVNNVVGIASSGVTLGGDGAGFSITGSGADGVHVESTASSGAIIGNIAHGNPGTGFAVEVVDETPPPFPIPTQRFILRGNSSLHNGFGFNVSHDEMRGIGEFVILTGNTVAGNSAVGIASFGFSFHTQIVGNVLTHNGTAIQLSGSDFQVSGNTLVANRGPGILINGGRPTNFVRVTDNTIVGNMGAGLYLIGATSDMTVRGNNIYGNASAPSSQVPGIDALNCGIANVDLEEPLDATNNYWGSTTGPGTDPADNAGKGCDFFSGKTTVKPFATAPFAFRP